jgi:flavin reductase (DIM6/NTAB) family NADH-FMN oxidoreductase RutF/rubredoxin
MNVNVLWNLSYGVYVISTMDGDRPTGCIANCAMQITNEPYTIAVSMNHDNYTNECIDRNGFFAISILAENSDPGIVGTFGFLSGKTVDKFKDYSYEMQSDMPVIMDSCGYLICKVINRMETDTHTVFLGEVIDGENIDEKKVPMTYAYYHKELKGRSPKNAPTYILQEMQGQVELNEDTKKNNKYVCKICGYVYEGETLPPDYICPICKQGADKFEKL